MLRAGVAYSLAEDKLGAARLRDKYAAKMAEGPDGRAFDVVTGGLGSNSPEFRARWRGSLPPAIRCPGSCAISRRAIRRCRASHRKRRRRGRVRRR